MTLSPPFFAAAASAIFALSACTGVITDGSGGYPGNRPSPEGSDPIAITLHANDRSLPGTVAVVAFGVPFPRGVQSSIDGLVLVDEQGLEVPATITELVPWRSLAAEDATAGSVRSALVRALVQFPRSGAKELVLLRNAEQTLPLDAPPDATANWKPVTEADYPLAIEEPPVYATFEPEWLGISALRSFMAPIGEEPWAWYDNFFVGAAKTATNEIDENFEKIDLIDNEPWLFDRTMTLFNVYARTGDVRWLRHAHRSAQFYQKNVTDGYFQLPDNKRDLKYSYGQSLFLDMMLTGDTRHLPTIRDIGAASLDWKEVYDGTNNFWTERHQTYALLAALSAWEATGEEAYAARAREVAAASFALAATPAEPGWPADRCLLHSYTSHEGSGGGQPICSPWMSALFSEAVFRYWLQSEDDAALIFLGDLAAWAAENAIYEGDELELSVPYYLVSSEFADSPSGQYADWEHTCDVAGLLIRGAYARRLRGQSDAAISSAADRLLESCRALLDEWHRPGSDVGPEFRISPPRKFNWWFGTTADMSWLQENG